MLKERQPHLRINFSPEFPKGESLLRRTYDISFDNLVAAYPIFGVEEYASRIPTFDDIHIEPLERMQARERANKPSDVIFQYAFLRDVVGVPEEKLDERFGVSAEYGLYLDTTQDRPQIYVSTDTVDRLSSANTTDRASTALNLGLNLVSQVVSNAPPPRALKPHVEWMEIMKAGLPKILQAMSKAYRVDLTDANMRKLTGGLSRRINEGCSIVARGARVYLILPEQAGINPETILGKKFDNGIKNLLLKNPLEKISSQIGSMFLKNPARIQSEPEERQAEAKVKNMEWYGWPLDRQHLMQDYLDSFIPTLYHSSGTGIRNNAWVYPELN